MTDLGLEEGCIAKRLERQDQQQCAGHEHERHEEHIVHGIAGVADDMAV